MGLDIFNGMGANKQLTDTVCDNDFGKHSPSGNAS